jgi:DNA-binding transcriptional regulator YdaS (Cro superfamily)
MKQEALAKAIQEVGGPKALSRHIGVTHQAISQWLRVPADRVLQVERATGVPRHELRPDLYPPTEVAA